ncbi:MAG: metalloregulator ArsR/SmtB family transcription factor [Neomegalonema sp.]|nr:metalloregulator ArsR/SmtB family transcription factor [Neomegalonema sp.]
MHAVALLSALAHEGRLEIFRLLVRSTPNPMAAGEIAEALTLRASTASNQLAELERAGLISSERQGRSILYRAELEQAGRLLGFLADDCCQGHPEACAMLNRAEQAAAKRC